MSYNTSEIYKKKSKSFFQDSLEDDAIDTALKPRKKIGEYETDLIGFSRCHNPKMSRAKKWEYTHYSSNPVIKHKP